jgi:PP-loop superfamily ATP-utilizing enzyme
LAAVEKAETAVRARGFRIVRVRHLGKKALLQVSPEETPRLQQPDLRKELMNDLRASGFLEVEFDSTGYQGSGLR